MRSSVLALTLTIMFAISSISLLFFAFEGGLGGRGPRMADSRVPRSLWLVVFAISLFGAFSLLGYIWAFPGLSIQKTEEEHPQPNVEKGETAIDAVLRVLNNEERKVVETLVTEGGTMLQKDIRWKTGFSRVKTHRILFRLAKRSIVSAEKYHNTNKIVLANWLKSEEK